MLTEEIEDYGLQILAGVISNYNLTDQRPSGYPIGVGVLTDSLGYNLNGFEFHHLPIDLPSLFGKGTQLEDNASRIYLGLTPRQVSSYQLKGYVGWSTYVANIRHLFSDWNFKQGLINSLDENPVSHFNLFGKTISGLDATVFYRPLSSLYEQDRPSPLWHFFISGSEDRPVFNPTHDVELSSHKPVGNLLAALPGISDGISNHDYDLIQDDYRQHYRDFEFEVTADGTLAFIVYTYDVQAFVSGWWYQVIHRIGRCFDLSLNPDSLDFNTEYNLSDYAKSRISVYQCKLITTKWLPGYGEPLIESVVPTFSELRDSWYENLDEWYEDTYFAHPPLNYSKVDELIGYSSTLHRYINNYSNHNFDKFQHASLHILSDCFPANFLSSKKAIDEHFERMKSNHIEAIAEIGDLFRLVDVAKALANLRKFNFRNVSTLRRLLDLVTDAKLTYSLGVAPSISDAKDIALRANQFLSKYSSPDIFGENTIYGKFNLIIPDDLTTGFSGVRLEARSKIRCSVLPDSYLTAVLPVRSLGLLPSLSNLWDLLPFSFVVDWFTHNGDNLDDIDSSAIMLALEINISVHSIAICYDFNSDDEKDFLFHISSDGPTKTAGYKTYCRYVLDTLPMLGPTRLSLHGVAGVPDWTLAASLLYKFITK